MAIFHDNIYIYDYIIDSKSDHDITTFGFDVVA